MAITTKLARETLKAQYLNDYMAWLVERGEDVMRTGSNECALPCVDANGDDAWLVITFKVPTGSRDGDKYDGYEMASDYTIKCDERKAKELAKAEAKAKKIAKSSSAKAKVKE